MKDTEFLELLNLYLDHEISAEDAIRLETEVQRSPARHRTYLEYCRMQKACTILAKDFADQPAQKKILAFEPRRSAWSGGLFAVGGLAVAAACVALVLVNRAPESNPGSSAGSKPSFAASKPVAGQSLDVAASIPSAGSEKLLGGAIARMVTIPVRRGELKPVFVSAPMVQSNADTQFEWMQGVQLAPMRSLPEQNVRLDARSPLQPASRTYTSGRSVQGTVEMTAFRFQK